MRTTTIVPTAAAVAFGVAWCLGSCSVPDVTTLPEDESEIRRDGPVAPAVAEEPAAEPTTPEPGVDGPSETPIATTITYEALTLRNVKGGRFQFVVPDTVGDGLRMLLDFEQAAGNRAWAQSDRTLSRSEEGVLAEWRFRGKMGIAPAVHLRSRVEHLDEGAVVRYELDKKAFGIASFLGDYSGRPLPGTSPRVELSERVLIDSGIPIANASQQDVEKGLREDVRLIRAWMERRTKKARQGGSV